MPSQEVIPEISLEVQDLLESISKDQNLRDYKFVNVSGRVKGEGYVGVVIRLRIEAKDPVTGKEKKLHVVAKCQPKSSAMQESIPLTEIWQRESYMYSTVLQQLHEFQLSVGIANPFCSFPRFYKSDSNIIILENLKETGYELWNKQERMNGAHVEFVLRQYGKFHATSFALRDQNLELFEKLTLKLTNQSDVLREKMNWDAVLAEHCKRALNSVDREADQECYTAFRKFTDSAVDFFYDVCTYVDEFSVILHADCWCNNMMFKYEDTNKLSGPIEMRFIDWQVSRHGPCVSDIAYFFYACSAPEVIDNYKYYLQQYYDSLATHLRELGSNPEKLFPFIQFENQWKMFAKYGLLLATLLVHVMYSEADEVIDISEAFEKGKGLEDAFSYTSVNDHKYRKVMRHMIRHFVENGLL